MNFRNRKLIISIRVLLGLMFLGSGIAGLMTGPDIQGFPESMIAIYKGLWSSGIFQMIKVTEIVSGLMLIFGILPALAAIFLAPICVGIIIFDLRLSPENIWAGIIVSVPTAYLGYAYWDKYKALFRS